MSLDVKGFDSLLKKLDSLGSVGDKVGKKAVRAGLKVVLDQEKKDAPKDSGNSASKLRITNIKQYKGGTVWGKVGIDGKNWEQCKALYYQHYGYINHRTGDKVTKHVGWMSESFEKCKSEAEQEMIRAANNEISSILR